MKSSVKFPTKTKSGQFVIIFFILLCLLSLMMIYILYPNSHHNKPQVQEISYFEVYDFNYYQINPNGISIHALGRKATQNQHNEDILIDITVYNYSFEDNHNEILYSDFAVHKDGLITFDNGVNYHRDSHYFWSQKATYQIRSKEFRGEGEFGVLGDNYNATGENIQYKNKKIFASNIIGKIKVN